MTLTRVQMEKKLLQWGVFRKETIHKLPSWQIEHAYKKELETIEAAKRTVARYSSLTLAEIRVINAPFPPRSKRGYQSQLF